MSVFSLRTLEIKTGSMSRRTNKQIKKAFLNIMSDGKIRSISQIARETQTNRDTVKRQLKKMKAKLLMAQVYNNKRCKLYQIRK